MYMKKRIVALLLASALLSALPVTALAAEYTDLTGHWSEPYITELTELGYLTGYTDGTVKPDKTITACEALALLSRFYRPSDDAVQLIHDDYGQFVSSYVDPNLSWAYDEIEICLAAGILSQNELKSLRLTSPIDKELLSVLLVRALQLTEEAQKLTDEGVELSFEDADDLSDSYVGYIAILVNNGIVEGNNHNQFTPHAEVTRAVVSAMVVRGLDYVEDLGRDLVLEEYEDVSHHEGLMTSYANGVLTLRDTYGVSRSYTVPKSAEISVSDGGTSLTSSYVGCYVSVRTSEGTVDSVTVRNEQGITFNQGVITEVAKSSNGYNVTYTNPDSNKSTRLLIPNTAKVTVDGVEKAVSDLKAGMFLTITQSGTTISTVTATSGDLTLTGTIQSLTYGTPAVLKISTEDGGQLVYNLDMSNLPKILWGANEASIERLTAKSSVTLTIRDCKLTQIAVESSADTIDGIVTSVVSTTGGTTWIITDENSTSHSLTLDPAANAYQNGTAILPGTIQVGDTVSAVVDGNTILEVYLISSANDTANKVSGTVLVVDTSAKQITMLNSTNRLIYISTKNVSSIIDAATGDTIRLSSLDVNSKIVAYGSYTDASNFAATSIVVEK